MGTGALSDEDMFKNVGPPESDKEAADKKAAPLSGGVPLVFGAAEEAAAPPPPPEPHPQKRASVGKPPNLPSRSAAAKAPPRGSWGSRSSWSQPSSR